MGGNSKLLEETILFGCCMNEYDEKGNITGHRTRSPEAAFIDLTLIQDLLSIRKMEAFQFVGNRTRSGYRSRKYVTLLDMMEKRIELAIEETAALTIND